MIRFVGQMTEYTLDEPPLPSTPTRSYGAPLTCCQLHKITISLDKLTTYDRFELFSSVGACCVC